MEIMSPVGSYESLMAAIQGGADSVYFGVGKLNMRSRSANNFGLDDLVKIAAIAREHGLRTYLTVNTVIYNPELEEMRQIVRTAKEAAALQAKVRDMGHKDAFVIAFYNGERISMQRAKELEGK